MENEDLTTRSRTADAYQILQCCPFYPPVHVPSRPVTHLVGPKRLHLPFWRDRQAQTLPLPQSIDIITMHVSKEWFHLCTRFPAFAGKQCQSLALSRTLSWDWGAKACALCGWGIHIIWRVTYDLTRSKSTTHTFVLQQLQVCFILHFFLWHQGHKTWRFNSMYI